MNQPKLSQIRIFIANWKISQSGIASKIGIRENAFNNKLVGRTWYKFSSEEEMALFQVMQEMQKQINMVMAGMDIKADILLKRLTPVENNSNEPGKPKKVIKQFFKSKNQEPIPGDILDTAPVIAISKKSSIAEAKEIPRGYRPLKKKDEYDF